MKKISYLWSWDTKRGQVNANQAYKVQLLEDMEEEPMYWYNELWKWQLPLKVKLFIWLMLEQRILTWENLNKRGFNGPSRCVLCGISEETMSHLFVECSFIKGIWQSILKELKLVSTWEGGQIVDCLQNWIRKKENWKEIPCFICWEVWKHRIWLYLKIFLLIWSEYATCILQDLGELKVAQFTKNRRIDRPPILDWDLAVGFFYGASQDKGTKCGAWSFIKMSSFGQFQNKNELW
jgi:hypothetical protein